MSLKELAQSYLFRFAAGARHTERAKRLDLQYLIVFLARYRRTNNPNELTYQDLTHTSIEKFMEDRLRVGESPNTVRRRLATIKHFCRTLAEELTQFLNPVRHVRPPSIDTSRPKAMTESLLAETLEQLSQILEERGDFKSTRDVVLIQVLLATGLRADEVRVLRRAQLSDCFSWLYDVRTKGRKFRKVYVPETIRPNLNRYLEARKQELANAKVPLSGKLDRGLPLFVSTFKSKVTDPDTFRMGEKTIWRIVKRLSHSHPHKLRHTFATNLLNSTNDIRLVAQALGHSDVRVTMKYTERTDEDIASALERSKLGNLTTSAKKERTSG